MKNRKGFTLVELIVTITLLALFGVAIGLTLNKTFKNNEEKEYKEFVSKIESSANLYLNNNFELLNQLYDKKGYIYITIKDLIDSGLLSNDLINPKTHKTVDLNELIKASLDSSGVLKITYPTDKTSDPYLQTIDIMVNVGDNEPEDGFCWYKLNEVSLGYIDANGYLLEDYLIKDDNIKCSIKNNEDIDTKKIGTYELKYEYKTTEGKWKSTTRKVIIVDKTEPSCGTIEGASTTWTKENRIITVNCTDEHSGCIKNPFIHTFTETTKDSNIIIKDKSGNTTSCPVNVYVDKTAPSCGTITGQSTTWTKDNRTIKVKCSDSDSTCEKSEYSTTYSSTTKEANIDIKDKAGNTKNCPVNVYVDKTSPTATLSLSGTKLTGTGQDGASGLKYYQFSTSSSLTDISKTGTEITPTTSKKEYTYNVNTEGSTTWYFYTQDTAGNISKSSPITVKITTTTTKTTTTTTTTTTTKTTTTTTTTTKACSVSKPIFTCKKFSCSKQNLTKTKCKEWASSSTTSYERQDTSETTKDYKITCTKKIASSCSGIPTLSLCNDKNDCCKWANGSCIKK